ncbi:hypothetical protein MPER_12360 [Moniliophthora perniciosa FA553]|nr:hypothetical protein MPER_12360 [Moniliophthora perniciosa FA553]
MLRVFQIRSTSSFTNLGHRTRTLCLTARRSDASTQKSFSGVVSPLIAEETQDISSLDRLLKAVRQRSNPDYHSIMPMRTPIMWSEVLLTSESKAPSPSEDIKTPKTSAVTALDLSPRNMHDSYTEFILPFRSSAQLLESYTNASGGIRTGK